MYHNRRISKKAGDSLSVRWRIESNIIIIYFLNKMLEKYIYVVFF